MTACGLTDRGLKREKNEDSILLDDDLKLYIVADGMGGHLRGEVASHAAVTEIKRYISAKALRSKGSLDDQTDYKNILEEAFAGANKEIYAYSQKQAGRNIMGTTASLAFVRAAKLYTAHIGDSSIYRVRKDRLEKLTKDHNQAQELVDAGLLEAEEAGQHESSHILTKALGSASVTSADLAVHDIRDGDVYLLATDGIFRVLAIETVKVILLSALSAAEKCRTLIDMTLKGGAPDNASLIILEF